MSATVVHRFSFTVQCTSLNTQFVCFQLLAMTQFEGIKPEQVMSGLAALRADGFPCDIYLEIDGKTISAHRVVLASVSPYFRALLNGNFKEANDRVIKMTGICFDGLRSIIDCMYSPGLTLNMGNLPGILGAANFLQIFIIVSQCEAFMKQQMSETTWYHFLEHADQYYLNDTLSQVTDFMLGNFKTLRHSTEFKLLPKDSLIHLFSHNELNTGNDESAVFYAIKDWLEYDEERMKFAEELLSNVRFMTIDKDKLVEIAYSRLIDEYKASAVLVRNALSFHENIFEQPLCDNTQNKARGKQGMLCIYNAYDAGIDGDHFGWENFEETTYTIYSWSDGKSKRTATLNPRPALDSVSVIEMNNYMFLFAVDSSSFKPITMRFNAATLEWITLASVPQQATADRAIAQLGGNIYLLRGYHIEKIAEPTVDNTHPHATATDEAFQYKIASNEWIKLSNMPKPLIRSAAAGSEMDGCVYFSGGWCKSLKGETPSLYAFDTEANKWLSKPEMLQPRNNHMIESVREKLYVFCGNEYLTNIIEIEEYDIFTEQWTVVGGEMETLSGMEGVSWVLGDDIFICLYNEIYIFHTLTKTLEEKSKWLDESQSYKAASLLTFPELL